MGGREISELEAGGGAFVLFCVEIRSWVGGMKKKINQQQQRGQGRRERGLNHESSAVTQ